MKRRELLTLLPAAAALIGQRSFGAPLAPQYLTEVGFNIAVQAWSFREFSLIEAIEKTAAVGANGIEVYSGQKIGGELGELKFSPDINDAQLQIIKDHLTKNQIKAVNLGVIPVSQNESEARKVFDLAKKLDLYGITTESLDAVDTLEKLAKEYDIKVCFHNHPKPTSLWNPDTVWNAIRDRHANLGFCADIGHWASSGLNPLEVVQKIASRLLSFHMKDRESIGAPSRDRPYGTGIIDLVAILNVARKHGFSGNISIEYEYNWKNSTPEIAQCVGYLRAYSKMNS